MEHWNIRYDGGELTLYGRSLQTLAEEYGTPLHIVDLKKLADNYHDFSTPQSRSGLNCELFLSYKTNPVPGTLTYLHQFGAGAEVISEYELNLAFKLGVPAQKIIYNGPAKSDASIKQAIAEGILMLNINHREEIDRVRTIAAALGKKVNVGLRVNSADTWAGQFGVSMSGGEALAVFQELLAVPEFNVVGVHCHRGVLIHSADEARSHVQNVLNFCQDLKQSLNFVPQIIDFGGSLSVPTTRHFSDQDMRLARTFLIEPTQPDANQALTPRAYAAIVTQAAEDWFAQHNVPPAKIVIEPGRAMTGNTQLLLTSVVSLRPMEKFCYAIMDAGVNIAEIMQSEFHQVFPVQKSAQPRETYRVVGPLCHLGDTLLYAWNLPKLAMGDKLAIMDSGAYFIPQSNSFSFLRPAIVALNEDGEDRLIRHRERMSDMLARDVVALPDLELA
ncbi:MAG: alanine racemase [Anaerolineaceae bacterium]|nr:alanine racemase [Anaerolineaceae bacterium]